MTDIKSAVKTSLLSENEVAAEVEEFESLPKNIGSNKTKPKKKRRGRPSKSHTKTKLAVVLKNRNMTRIDLCRLVAEKYPDEPISPDAISRIVSGSRSYYSTRTLFRICGALKITPNMALNWEEEVI